MNEINIGNVIIENRRKMGITQVALASYMGVSKAAVSKWETGASLPDVSLLPRLASFFDISIDELVGYVPQMNIKDIRELHRKLARDFYALPFGEAVKQCREIAKKYYSCYPLLFQLGSLLINHFMLATDDCQARHVKEEALEWFHRIRSNAGEPILQKQALQMEAYCLISLDRPAEAIAILDFEDDCITSSEPLLASAHQLMGNMQKSKEILQIGIYKSLMSLLSLLPAYFNICLDDIDGFSETCARFNGLVDLFKVKVLHPGILLGSYVSMAQGWMFFGKTDMALECLEQYTDLATSDIYPLRLHEDPYFNLLKEWFERSTMLGDYPPRDEAVIRHSMTQALVENPVFSPLADNKKFMKLIARLKDNEEEI